MIGEFWKADGPAARRFCLAGGGTYATDSSRALYSHSYGTVRDMCRLDSRLPGRPSFSEEASPE